MRVSQNLTDGQKTPPTKSSTVIFLTMADTTWRMAVPSAGCTLLGYWCDGKLHTTPWLLLVGSIIGLIIAGFAVRSQLKKLQ